MKLSIGDYPTDRHGWAELLGARRPRPRLNGSHRVPWAVIGAGVTGLSSARRLAELHPDQEIMLLDARVIGQGSSGRNSGFAVAVSRFEGPLGAEEKANYRRVNRINQVGLGLLRTQVEKNGIDCQWQEEGFHHTAADQRAMHNLGNYLRYLEAMEVAHTPLDREALNARLGTAHYQAGVHLHLGALMQPAALVRGLAACLPANVTLHEQSPVLKIENGAPLTLRLANGDVQTDRLILATNYEVAKLGYLKRYLIGSTLSGSFTRPLSEDELAGAFFNIRARFRGVGLDR